MNTPRHVIRCVMLPTALFFAAFAQQTAKNSAAPAEAPAPLEIKIHWLDARTGQPLPNFQFMVNSRFRPLAMADGHVVRYSTQSQAVTSGGDGTAIVTTPAPGPLLHIFSLPWQEYNRSKWTDCSEEMICTADLRAQGYGPENICEPGKVWAGARSLAPGEVYMYAKKIGRLAASFGSTGLNRAQVDRFGQLSEATLKRCPVPGVPPG